MTDSIYEKLRLGDIITTTSDDWIGKIIRWVTDSKHDHIAIYIDKDLLIESQNGKGVNFNLLENYMDDPKVEINVCRVKRLSGKKAEKVIEIAKGMSTQGYDLMGLLGIFTKKMVEKLNRVVNKSWLGRFIKLDKIVTFFGENRLNDGKSYWCSEFVGFCFGEVGVKFTDFDISYLTPDEIYNSPIVAHIK